MDFSGGMGMICPRGLGEMRFAPDKICKKQKLRICPRKNYDKQKTRNTFMLPKDYVKQKDVIAPPQKEYCKKKQKRQTKLVGHYSYLLVVARIIHQCVTFHNSTFRTFYLPETYFYKILFLKNIFCSST